MAETINITLDTAPPALSNIRPVSGSVVGLSTLDLFLSAESNEPLQSLTVNGSPLGVNIADILFQDQIKIFGDGQQSLIFVATDKAGNQLTVNHVIDTTLDDDDPVITISGLSSNQMINQSSNSISVNIVDSSFVEAQVIVNGTVEAITDEKVFNQNIVLQEGVNSIVVKAIDSVDRRAEVSIDNIKVDTKKPILTLASPSDGQEFEDQNVLVNLTSNEPLSSITINGNIYPLNGATSFNQTIEVPSFGPNLLMIDGRDLIGNVTTIDVPLFIQVPSGSSELLGDSYFRHACSVVDGASYCWGENARGQVGDGTTETRFSPVAINELSSGVTRVETHDSYTCSIKDGNLYCNGKSGVVGRTGNSDPITVPTLFHPDIFTNI
ncbi:MAG: RCC1 domain-containing protein, partial [Bdellovibrionales bacterium]|nr:RCC1 domain-containing protein [Bdellovibrionales bacterium]